MSYLVLSPLTFFTPSNLYCFRFISSQKAKIKTHYVLCFHKSKYIRTWFKCICRAQQALSICFIHINMSWISWKSLTIIESTVGCKLHHQAIMAVELQFVVHERWFSICKYFPFSHYLVLNSFECSFLLFSIPSWKSH